MKPRPVRSALALLPVAVVALAASACGGMAEGDGELQRFTIPSGASFSAIADSLDVHDLIGSPTLFRIYARLTGAADEVQAGTYEFREGVGYRRVLRDLTGGNVASARFVLPEGYGIEQVAPKLAEITGLSPDSVARYMLDTAAANRFDVPGPTLEGYLYPATYVVPVGARLDPIIGRMVAEHRKRWTPERQARADSAGLSQREVVTLASIVEKEAKVRDEMDTIAAVYRNRLDIGYPLQADPTVQYALGEHQNRLLYRHIDEVANHPYNTYTQPGIPPGPIGAPSARAIDAVLEPADVNYLYFVARPDGSHVFNRHLVDHNRAKNRIRRERTAAQAEASRAEAEGAPRDSAAADDSSRAGTDR